MRYNNEVTKLVIIQDHTQALCLQLKDDYEEQIERILEQAKTQAGQIVTTAQDQARTKAARMIETGIANAKIRYAQRRLAASYAAKQEKEAARQAFLENAMTHVDKEIERLPQQRKNRLAKKLYEDLKAIIKEEGYNENDFTYDVYKGLKIAGTKPVYRDIKVVATSGHLVFEDSLAARLAQRQDHIRQAASALID